MKFRFFYIEDQITFEVISGDINSAIKNINSSISKRLDKASMKKQLEEDNSVSFKGSIFRFVWNGFDFFNTASKGFIKLKPYNEKVSITYRLFFWEALVITLIFNMIPIFGIFPNYLYRILGFVIIWLIFLIAELVSCVRLDSYLKKIIESNGGLVDK